MLPIRGRRGPVTATGPVEAARAAAALHEAGVAVTLERRAGATTRVGAAAVAVEDLRTLLAALGQQTAPRSPDVVLLLPALVTPLATDALPAGHVRSDAVVLDRAQQVCRAARNAGVGVTVDTDDRLPVDRALGILRDLRKDFPETGVVVRAGLHRAEADCRGLAHEGSRVRLLRGGLPHRAHPTDGSAPGPGGRGGPADRTHAAYRSGLEADRSFVRCLRVLMAGQGTPEVDATDELLLRVTRALAGRHARAAGSYELLVAGRDLARADALAADGECVRAVLRWGRRASRPPETLAAALGRAVDGALGRARVRALDLRDRAAELAERRPHGAHRSGGRAGPAGPADRPADRRTRS
ncbi:hypothetical protein [Nocardioides perillae]|uniref:Proline dehydrogenase n=1 Tax=Nocardioides perillae TaxID=1119534 RepID=A0A7Y9RNT8_9ACTN|nr:hypothetical protein [Nocardioides perillae]NYG53796.1 proline dehydrogenase [Nocardioides perillae]